MGHNKRRKKPAGSQGNSTESSAAKPPGRFAAITTRFWLWYAAIVAAAVFIVGTGIVAEPGRWYSRNIYFREQTEALLRGSFALQTDPSGLRNDLVWHNGGVQQVWGLGVPFWRLPFEILAKLFGQKAFPDRLAFAIAFMLIAYSCLKAFLAPAGPGKGPPVIAFTPARMAAALVLLAFPSFVALCHFQFDVYEEAVAYGYLAAIGLFAGVLSFIRSPSRKKYCLLAFLAGLAPFIRPTVGAYSIATLVLLAVYARRARISWPMLAVGCALFVLDGGMLLLTNWLRFGAGFEFGHNLNINGFPVALYTRFANPFEHEPWLSAGKELIGELFNLDGQSPTPRWRQLYFTSLGASAIAILTVAWGTWFWSLAISRRGKAAGTIAPTTEAEMNQRAELTTAGWWSLIGVIILTVFYLRISVMSSRYLVDFGPAFAVAIAGLLLRAESSSGKQPSWIRPAASWCLLIALTGWVAWELGHAKTTKELDSALTRREVLGTMSVKRPEALPLPDSYEAGRDSQDQYGIFLNGIGWRKDGQMSSFVYLAIADPQFLRIWVAPNGPDKAVDYHKIEAKVGLEFLKLESIKEDGQDGVITFQGPQRAVYQKGVQELFLAYVDKAHLSNARSPLRLLKVQWREAATGAAIKTLPQ